MRITRSEWSPVSLCRMSIADTSTRKVCSWPCSSIRLSGLSRRRSRPIIQYSNTPVTSTNSQPLTLCRNVRPAWPFRTSASNARSENQIHSADSTIR